MALSKKSAVSWLLSRLHFLVRVAGLTGLVVAGVGLFLSYLDGLLSWEALRSAAEGTSPQSPGLDLALLLGGAAVFAAALLVELLVVLRLVAVRRGAFGFNVGVQVLLAVVLLVGVNLFSACPLDFELFGHHVQSPAHYVRLDWTRDQKFTLPEDVRADLAKLRGETTIVVYQRHRIFGQMADKPDAFDYAAERKVVEKVKDLVEQFREFGPQFRVVVLDVEEEDYQKKLARETEGADELRKAIEAAPESSIFFYANGKVQRLSFNEFYQLDKTASQQADEGKGNLVLLAQGVRPFANKVLNIDERKPRVAIGVTHEWLTTQGPAEEYTLAGLKKALESRGFEVRDVVLKRWSRRAPPEPAVYTYDESKFERLEERVAVLDAQLRFFEGQLKAWQAMTPEELRKRRFTPEERDEQVKSWASLVEQTTKQKDAAVSDQQRLQVESLEEQRRITDIRAKMDRVLLDCDLLILPRITLQNITRPGLNVPNELHQLDEAQVSAIRDFIKAGKPVLFCFGPPVNDPPDEDEERPTPIGGKPDNLELMLEQLGLKFAPQVVLFDREIGALAEYQAALQGRGRLAGLIEVTGDDVEVPPVAFTRASDADGSTERQPHPIRESMRLTARSLGKDQVLDLRLRHPRPITFTPRKGQAAPIEAEFMLTDPQSWEEDQPFPTRRYLPRYSEKRRRGPLPIGVAVDVRIPDDWYAAKETRPAEPDVRLAAIGSGGLFIGNKLNPAREKLLLDVCNWLLKRDELLTRGDEPWQYPRVSLSPREQALWEWGAWFGPPALFAYLGMLVLLVRRLR
jgi:hypothetical protein